MTALTLTKIINARRGSRNRANLAALAEARGNREFRLFLWLTILHLPLGVALYRSAALGALHAFAVAIVGLRFALQDKPNSFVNTAYCIAYLTGTEVLWRMAHVPIFWEYGKYAAVLIMLVALLKRNLLRPPALPLAYFLLLVPGCLLTLASDDFADARGKISFNMSGPLALFVACWFFSNFKLNPLQIRRFFLWLVIPVISIAGTALFYTVSVEEIAFTTESNSALSGGFGPNQVSSVLGLGVFVSLFCLITMPNRIQMRLYLGATIVLLAAQSVLTFSRGGMYNAIGGILVVVTIYFYKSGNFKRIVPVLVLATIFGLLIFPFLDDFTGGKLQDRFEDTGTTNRTEIIESDFVILLENPIMGVGVGESRNARRRIVEFAATSHTEFSRLISEHGSFGVFALLMLIAMSLFNFQNQLTPFGKALAAGVVVWSSLFMFNAGMRIVAPSIFWSLGFAQITAKPFGKSGDPTSRTV